MNSVKTLVQEKEYSIKLEIRKSEFSEEYVFQAYDLEGKRIFGADANIYRSEKYGKSLSEQVFIPRWGSCLVDTLKEKEIQFKVIECAMNFARAQKN